MALAKTLGLQPTILTQTEHILNYIFHKGKITVIITLCRTRNICNRQADFMSSAQNSMLVLYVMTPRYNKKYQTEYQKLTSQDWINAANFKYTVLILFKFLFTFPPFTIINVYIYCQ
jgi:hypothetical protein